MAIQSFLRGVGSIFNIWPSRQSSPIPMPMLDDNEQMRQDFQMVGDDIRGAMAIIDGELKCGAAHPPVGKRQ